MVGCGKGFVLVPNLPLTPNLFDFSRRVCHRALDTHAEIRGPWIHTDEGKISEIQYHVGVQGEDSVLFLLSV